MYKVALNFEDGVTRFVQTLPGENVADAAYRSGLNIPLDCRDGACGTCKCHCESGQYEMSGFIDDALSDSEADQRYVLTCCMVPESDCIVSVPASSEVCVRSQLADVHATISEIDRLSSSTLSFKVSSDQVRAMHFLPGQYVNIQVPNSDQSRAYSFSSMVDVDTESVSFLIRVIPDGVMSGYLSNTAKVGDSITLRGPYGSFYLRDVQRPILMLAGGTGLAPFLAMLNKLEIDGLSHPIHLIYGVNNDTDLVELDKLNHFAERLDNFTFVTCVADEKSQNERIGFVTHHMDTIPFQDIADFDLYLCGPPAMVEAVSQYLQVNSIKPSHFYYEKFASSK